MTDAPVSPGGPVRPEVVDEDRELRGAVHALSWIPLLWGIAAIVAGIVVLAWPGQTIEVIAVIVGIFLVIAAPVEIAHALGLRHVAREWWILLLHGLVDLVFGILLLVWPGKTITVLVWLFGLELLLFGAFELLAALLARGERVDRASHVWRAVATVAVGIILLAWPHATVSVLAIAFGIVLLLIGFGLVLGSTLLRRTARRI